MQVGWVNIGDFRQIAGYISTTVQDRRTVSIKVEYRKSSQYVTSQLGGKGGSVTSAGWQVTVCDLIWHVSSRSGVAA